MNSSHKWSELVAPYALGALEGKEREDFAEHLEGCEACRRELSEMLEVGAVLASATDVIQPPAHLRDRILADARGTRQLTAAPSRAAAAAAAAAGGGSLAAAGGASVAARRGLPAWVPWLAAAASVAFAVSSLRSAARERSDRMLVVAALDSATATLAARDSMLAWLRSPQLSVANLVSTSAGVYAPLRLIWDHASRKVIVLASNLAPAPAGRDYQLWGIATGSAPVSLGTFNTAPDGTLLLTFNAPAGFDPSVGAVTEEPDGGSSAPTSTPILLGELKRVQ